MEYKTAKTYTNWTRVGEPFEKNKKMYQKVKTKCDRCGGLGLIASRVENGQIIPIPVANGVCFKCGGAKYMFKEVRLYTEEEYNKMELANEKNRQKKEEELKIKMRAEYQNKKAKWIEDNGFSAEGATYVAIGDTYSIKDELKAAGFTYSPVLKWHKATPDESYQTIKVDMDSIVEFSAWGTGSYKIGAGDLINELLDATLPKSNSEWVGETGSRISMEVIFVKRHGFMGKFGASNVYTFEDDNENLYTWFSTVEIKHEIGDRFILTGTVKEHSEYKGTKSTVLSRCRIKEV